MSEGLYEYRFEPLLDCFSIPKADWTGLEPVTLPLTAACTTDCATSQPLGHDPG